MATFTPLWSTLVTSSIWQTSKETRLVWITLLAMKDAFGVVQASIPGLANLANVTVEECEKAIEELMAPDKYSRTKSNDGRRITACASGWCILNHDKYRNLMADRREYWRSAKAKQRQKFYGKNKPVNYNDPAPTGTDHFKEEAVEYKA